MTVSEQVIKSRLEPIGIKPFKINLSRAELNVMVTRKFMSSVYGGSSEGTFPPIGKEKLAEHGMNDFMYLHLDYQPCAPQVPGKCGLWFSTGSRRGNLEGVYRVITRDLRRSQWQYMGQYHIKPAKSLTKEEWVSQDDKVRRFFLAEGDRVTLLIQFWLLVVCLQVKNTWATKICCKKWGRFVRARIEFRKSTEFDRAPTDEEVDFILESGLWQNTTTEDVKAAFNSGEEVWKFIPLFPPELREHSSLILLPLHLPSDVQSLDHEVRRIRLRFSIGLVCEIPLVDSPTTNKAASKCRKKAKGKEDCTRRRGKFGYIFV